MEADADLSVGVDLAAGVGGYLLWGGGGKDAEAADKLVGYSFHDDHDDNYFEFGPLPFIIMVIILSTVL